MDKSQQPIYLTDFAGQSENASVGAGVSVGLDLFTTKSVARLSRKMVKRSGSVVDDLCPYVCLDKDDYIYTQDDSGVIYNSLNNGITWTVFPGNSGDPGCGIIAFEDTNPDLSSRKKYLLSFTPDDIDLYDFSAAAWTNGWWTSGGGANQPALQNQVSVDSNIIHLPYAYGLATYFCNGNFIGLLQLFSASVVATDPSKLFDPTDPTTFIATDMKFQLDNGYISTTFGFLPPSTFGIGFVNTYNPSQIGVVIWDGVQIATYTNLVNLPGASNPVMQLITKNGILYAVTNKEHAIYTINGSSAQLVDRLALRMSNRTAGGAQNTLRIASTIRPQGIDFLGPELLTGGANFPSPVTQISGTGMYPYGVWSVNIENKVIGTRFPLSHGDINAQYSSDYAIGFIKVLKNNSVVVSWQKGNTYGIDVLDSENYITDANTVFLESSLYLAGTRLRPATFNVFEFNLIAPLSAGQEITFYWRSNQSMDYQPFNTVFTATRLNGELAGTIQTLPFQKIKYIQIGAKIKTGTSTNLTPQFRDALLR